MLSEYQLNIVNLYNIPIGNIKKLVPNLSEIVIHYENVQLYFN